MTQRFIKQRKVRCAQKQRFRRLEKHATPENRRENDSVKKEARTDRVQDVAGVERDVLNPRSVVVLAVLLDLRLALARRRLVDGHLDGLLVVGDDRRAQGRVLGVHEVVVDGPEPVEEQVVLVPASSFLIIVII